MFSRRRRRGFSNSNETRIPTKQFEVRCLVVFGRNTPPQKVDVIVKATDFCAAGNIAKSEVARSYQGGVGSYQGGVEGVIVDQVKRASLESHSGSQNSSFSGGTKFEPFS